MTLSADAVKRELAIDTQRRRLRRRPLQRAVSVLGMPGKCGHECPTP